MIPQVLEGKFSDISRENVAIKYSCNFLIAVILNVQNFSVDTTNLQYIYIYIQNVQNLGFSPIIDSNVYW